MAGLVADLVTDGHRIEELNLGGGMGIAYTPTTTPRVQDMAKQLQSIVTRECELAGVPVPRLAVEPGRAIVGSAGITVYEVGTVKTVDLGGRSRLYVSVDGGMSDNIRTALYGAGLHRGPGGTELECRAGAEPGRGQALRERGRGGARCVAAGRRAARGPAGGGGDRRLPPQYGQQLQLCAQARSRGGAGRIMLGGPAPGEPRGLDPRGRGLRLATAPAPLTSTMSAVGDCQRV